jgi:Flp pilus assembly protein TadG
MDALARRQPSVHRVPRRGEAGSAVVEFALVMPLLVTVCLAVVQFALLLDVRSTLASAAAEGARAAALAGADPRAGVARTRALLDQNVAGSAVRSVTARPEILDGLPVMTVHVEADLPLLGLLGPTVLAVDGRALREDA